MPEITDAGITRAALRYYGIALYRECVGGSRFFGVDIYVDMILRCKELAS